MSAKLEQLIKKKKEKKTYGGPPQLKVKKNTDINTFPPAIVDGKFVIGVGSWVIYERKRSGIIALHVGTISSIEDNGNVDIWDETMQQCFGFNLNETVPVIRSYER